MFPHATEDLAQRAEVTTTTLLKWKQRGFFEDCLPHRTSDGKTTGAGYRWSDAAMARVTFIKQQRDQGFNMDQILATLHAQGVPTRKKRRGR